MERNAMGDALQTSIGSKTVTADWTVENVSLLFNKCAGQNMGNHAFV